jgi:calcium/calmodulin-dependent protein kinase I
VAETGVPSSLSEHSDSSSGAIMPRNERRTEGDDSGLTKEVALKVITKKKVKGNEASVWEEMEVLKGLNHPNIVRAFSLSTPHSRKSHSK